VFNIISEVVRDLDRDVVLDEEVGCSVRGAKDELSNLE